ncbi:MAG TPA: prephenate dehydratase [Phycisphaerales bacterium]|nr:prephenate dehydratase [Phycisphaerales bacterium]
MSVPQESSKPARPARPLSELRAAIDSVDQRLIQLLNERARLVVEVGESKRESGAPIYAPHREAEVLQRVLAANQSLGGLLPPRTIEAVYREIMSGSFALERPLRIGYLGPAGSFSHQAATEHFGSSVEFEDLHEISGVFTEVVRGHCDYGLVPIENSIGGGIAETLDAFRDAGGGGGGGSINVYAEVLLAVHHALCADCAPHDVKRIHSKAEAFSQCRNWLATQYPKAELIAATSTSKAVQTARAEQDRDPASGSAAIASTLAAHLYDVAVLFEDIEDDPSNVTRFFIISKQSAKPTGNDKTSIMFTTADKPGALVSVLRAFEENGINLTHIDKRPSRRVNWTYTFFIDAVGHRDDPKLTAAVTAAKAHCAELFVLGSYPKAERIL